VTFCVYFVINFFLNIQHILDYVFFLVFLFFHLCEVAKHRDSNGRHFNPLFMSCFQSLIYVFFFFHLISNYSNGQYAANMLYVYVCGCLFFFFYLFSFFPVFSSFQFYLFELVMIIPP